MLTVQEIIDNFQPEPLDEQALEALLDEAAKKWIATFAPGADLAGRSWEVKIPRHSINRAQLIAAEAGWLATVSRSREGGASARDRLICEFPSAPQIGGEP